MKSLSYQNVWMQVSSVLYGILCPCLHCNLGSLNLNSWTDPILHGVQSKKYVASHQIGYRYEIIPSFFSSLCKGVGNVVSTCAFHSYSYLREWYYLIGKSKPNLEFHMLAKLCHSVRYHHFQWIHFGNEMSERACSMCHG